MTPWYPISEAVELARVAPSELDRRLALGWRHFGTLFFRQSHAIHDRTLCRVLPLRVRVADFVPSKSQRRVIRRNADLAVNVQPTRVDDEKHALFKKHVERFHDNIPTSLHDFLSTQPAIFPCTNREVGVYQADRLLAVSFLDVGAESVSSVYAMFDPDVSDRSLGILTELLELDYARLHDKRYYYLGYAYDVPSHYDYKKRFHALEAFDWVDAWEPIERLK